MEMLELILGALLQGVTVFILVAGLVFLIGLAVIFALWYMERGGRR